MPRLNKALPAGLLGEVRRTAPGGRLEIDHAHDEVEFDIVLRGSGSYAMEGTRYQLRPGTLIWFLPGRQHRLARSPQLEMWVVSVRAELIEAAWRPVLADQPARMLAAQELVDLDRLLAQISQDSDEPAAYNAGIAYAVRRAWRASQDRPAAHMREMHPAVARALLLLRESEDAPSLSDLAREAGVAAPYLSRLLVEHTGRSFVEWRNRVRLDRFLAAYRPGANLLESALAAGFGSYARFHNVFSDMMGAAPSDWVRRAEAEGGAAPAEYGVAGEGVLSTRQRWAALLRCMVPEVERLVMPDFIARVLSGPAVGGIDRLVPVTFPPPVRARLVAALRLRDADQAEALAGLLAAHDFLGTFAELLEVHALSPASLVDAVTALLLALWVAGTLAHDPGLDEIAAVRAQVQAALGRAPERLAPAAASAAHAALLCQFVVAAQALQAVRAGSDPRAAAELQEAARFAGQNAFGADLAGLVLTRAGFVRKPL